MPHNTKEIRHVYKVKHNLKRGNQIILLMITDCKKWHYLVVKSLSILLRGITSNHKEVFHCLNCFRSYNTKNRLKKHKNVCENHDYCYVEMPEEDNRILKYNYGEKSLRTQFTIYADLECSLEKMSTYHNDPEKSSITKVNKHTPSGYSLFTCSSFDSTENKLDYYKGKDCMKKFCKVLKEHATRIINYEKKKEEKMHNKQKNCYICKKRFSTDDNSEKYHKVRDHCHYSKFIDSFRFMSSSLSSLIDNLAEGLRSDKCAHCKSCLDYISTIFGALSVKIIIRKTLIKN